MVSSLAMAVMTCDRDPVTAIAMNARWMQRNAADRVAVDDRDREVLAVVPRAVVRIVADAD